MTMNEPTKISDLLRQLVAASSPAAETKDEFECVDHPCEGPDPLVSQPAPRSLLASKQSMMAMKARAKTVQYTAKSTDYRGAISALAEFTTMGVAPKPTFYRFSLALDYDLFTGAGSTVNVNVVPSSPSIAVDWASAAAMFQAFRVRSVRVMYLPRNRYGKATTIINTNPGYVVSDFQNSTALASANAAVSLVKGVSMVSLEDPWEHELVLPMNVAPYNVWIPTTSPVSVGWIKFYFDSLTASATYGRYMTVWDIEFLGQT